MYACDNLLGQNCLEDGEDRTKNCLSSLENKNKSNAVQKDGSTDGLFYVNLRRNPNLKYVDYLKTDIDIKYLYLIGCNSEMNVNNISNIILGCGTNYDLPCKFLTGTTYTWSDYYYNGSAIEGKEELTADNLKQDLKDNTTITCLDLHDCKKSEITDEVLNEILKTMPQLKYVRLDGTNLKTLGFCDIKGGTSNSENDLKNLELSAYCPNLIELDLRNTYVTDISNLNNVIKKTTQNPEGRNMGTLRLSKSLEVDDKTETNKLVNLSEIQDVINGLDSGCYYLGSSSGFVASDIETMKLLEDCIGLKKLNSVMWGSVLHSNEGLDLSRLNSLSTVFLSGWDFRVEYPSGLKSFSCDQMLPPVFAEGSSLNTIAMQAVEKSYMRNLESGQWRDFFKSLERCSSVGSLSMSRCESINDDCFYESNAKNEKVEIFTGNKIKNCSINSNGKGMHLILEHLVKVRELYFESKYEQDNWENKLSFDNLTSLTMKGKFLNDFSIFNNLEGLTTLKIVNCENFKTLSGLEDLTSLTSLTVNDTGITSVIPLKNLINLTYLDLKNNAIGPFSVEGNENVSNLDILASLHPNGSREGNTKGKLKQLYLQGNDSLSGVIDNHSILELEWTNGSIW